MKASGPEDHISIVAFLADRYLDAAARCDFILLEQVIAELLPYVLNSNVFIVAFLKIDFAMEVLINGAYVHDNLYRASLGKGRKASEMFSGRTEEADLHFLKRYLYSRAAERFFAENNDILQRKEESWECIVDNRPLLESAVRLLFVAANATRRREHVVRAFDALEEQESTYLVPYIQDCVDTLLFGN